MKKNLTTEIIKFFDEMKCPLEFILKNKNKRAEYEYYLIHNGESNFTLNKDKYLNFLNFQRENKITILGFYSKNCTSKEDLIKKFEAEEYKIIFQKK